jgi:hypothetical protein
MRIQRVTGVSAGFGAVVLFVGGLAVAGAMATGAMPLPGGDPVVYQRFLAQNGAAEAVAMVTQAGAALALVVFAAYLAGVVGEERGGRLVLAGGVGAAVLQMVSVMASWVAGRALGPGDVPVVGVLQDLSFVAGGVGHVAFLGLMVAPVARGGVVPRWLGIAAGVFAGFAVLSVLTFVDYGATLFIPLGRFGTLLWIIAFGVVHLVAKTQQGTFTAEKR